MIALDSLKRASSTTVIKLEDLCSFSFLNISHELLKKDPDLSERCRRTALTAFYRIAQQISPEGIKREWHSEMKGNWVCIDSFLEFLHLTQDNLIKEATDPNNTLGFRKLCAHLIADDNLKAVALASIPDTDELITALNQRERSANSLNDLIPIAQGYRIAGKLNEYERVIKKIDHVVFTKTNYVEILNLIIQEHIEAGNLEKATETALIIPYESRNYERRCFSTNLALELIAQEYMKTGNLHKATKVASEISRKKININILQRIACKYIEAGNLQKAEKAIDKMVDKDSFDTNKILLSIVKRHVANNLKEAERVAKKMSYTQPILNHLYRKLKLEAFELIAKAYIESENLDEAERIAMLMDTNQIEDLVVLKTNVLLSIIKGYLKPPIAYIDPNFIEKAQRVAKLLDINSIKYADALIADARRSLQQDPVELQQVIPQ